MKQFNAVDLENLSKMQEERTTPLLKAIKIEQDFFGYDFNNRAVLFELTSVIKDQRIFFNLFDKLIGDDQRKKNESILILLEVLIKDCRILSTKRIEKCVARLSETNLTEEQMKVIDDLYKSLELRLSLAQNEGAKGTTFQEVMACFKTKLINKEKCATPQNSSTILRQYHKYENRNLATTTTLDKQANEDADLLLHLAKHAPIKTKDHDKEEKGYTKKLRV